MGKLIDYLQPRQPKNGIGNCKRKLKVENAMSL